jgi:small-conductance mechanosensitive channel
MDLEHPFSEAFGPASTRDELIVSAQNVYVRLLKLAPGSRVLPAPVLTALSDNEDGTVDKAKKNALRNLFRPDSGDNVPLLAFIQSCDTVYKKLRYFRASVGNASVIDKVLEGIIDAVFGFVLALIILSLLQFNPWPLLVSMSTLLVTFAFAVGPSAAKAIEVSRPNKEAIQACHFTSCSFSGPLNTGNFPYC